MNLVSKALWYIESHFAEEISLEDIAIACDVSRFHLSRAFGLGTGRSVMRYVRGRRLTEAARALARGAPDILGVALDAGYGSHEAFTRAFRDQFGVTPEAVRQRGDLEQLELMEPMTMTETGTVGPGSAAARNMWTVADRGAARALFQRNNQRHPDAVAAVRALDRRDSRAGRWQGLRRVLRLR